MKNLWMKPSIVQYKYRHADYPKNQKRTPENCEFPVDLLIGNLIIKFDRHRFLKE